MGEKKKKKAKRATKGLAPAKMPLRRRELSPAEKNKIKEKVREIILEGRRLFDSGDYDRALPLLKKVHELDDRLPDILNMLGLIYHQKGKFNQALQCFEEALAINPKYTEASLNLAVTCNDLGRFQEAKYVFSRAKDTAQPSGALDPYVKGRLANMHADIADVYKALGRHQEACDEYRKALDLRPTFVDIQTKLGIVLRELGENAQSLQILKTACKNAPDYMPAAVNLGLTYFSLEKSREAIRVWKGVLERDKNNEMAQMYLRLVRSESMPLKGRQ